MQANPQYAHVRYADGQETTVSTRHLAPSRSSGVLPRQDAQTDSTNLTSDGVNESAADGSGDATISQGDMPVSENVTAPTSENTTISTPASPTATPNLSSNSFNPILPSDPTTPEPQALRHSTRQRRPRQL